MTRALLVIDVQESFRRRPYFRAEELPEFLRNVQSLIDRCQGQGIAVVQIFHREPGEDAGNPFTMASGFVRSMPELSLRPQFVGYKEVHSAMFARDERGQTLEQWLRREGVGELLITGIRTEQCCETTARVASDLGYDVTFVTDATATFPTPHWDAPDDLDDPRTMSAADMVARTEYALAGRFATIKTTEELGA